MTVKRPFITYKNCLDLIRRINTTGDHMLNSWRLFGNTGVKSEKITPMSFFGEWIMVM
jgi:hypothetical protein